jgi:hypothetical protein
MIDVRKLLRELDARGWMQEDGCKRMDARVSLKMPDARCESIDTSVSMPDAR